VACKAKIEISSNHTGSNHQAVNLQHICKSVQSMYTWCWTDYKITRCPYMHAYVCTHVCNDLLWCSEVSQSVKQCTT